MDDESDPEWIVLFKLFKINFLLKVLKNKYFCVRLFHICVDQII